MRPKWIALWAPILCLLGWPATPSSADPRRELVVSAAASLTNAFSALGAAFETTHPGVRVTLNFGASGALLQQIEQGAPVDVFATADQETMDLAAERGRIDPGTRRDFARSRLVLVAPARSPAPPTDLAALGGEGVGRIALGDPGFVPAGRYARQALEAAALWDLLQAKLILAGSVRQVLDYVVRGEVDAGFVYETDALLRADRVRVAATLAGHAPILYPIAAVSGSRHPPQARDFVAFASAPEGQAVLARFGFRSP